MAERETWNPISIPLSFFGKKCISIRWPWHGPLIWSFPWNYRVQKMSRLSFWLGGSGIKKKGGGGQRRIAAFCEVWLGSCSRSRDQAHALITLHESCCDRDYAQYRISRDILQTEIRNFDGNGPRPGERCERKWRIFAKIHPNVRLEGPGTEQNFRFGSAWPVRVCPCGHVLRQFGIAGRRINFCSFCLFFSYVIIFEIVELYSVHFVFSSCSMFSSSELQAITKPSISPSEGVVTREKAWKSAFCS